MSLANEKSLVPPGFRFHPTEEELLHYYLKKKVTYQKIDLDVIRDVDLNKLEPWDIQEKCKIGSTPQNEWYFFNHKDKKYPTGIRVNRATAAGFWKATGRDKVIYSSFKRIGMRKTLVFHKGRAPHGLKSNWIMHEYRLDNNSIENIAVNPTGETTQDNGWVVCRIFKKKNDQKSVDSPNHSLITTNTMTQMLKAQNDGPLDQILQYMGSTCKQESEASKNINITNNMGLLREFDVTICNDVEEITNTEASMTNHGRNGNLSQVYHNSETSPNDWIILDRLVACCNDPNLAYYPSLDHDFQFQQLQLDHCSQEYNNEIVLWNFTRS